MLSSNPQRETVDRILTAEREKAEARLAIITAVLDRYVTEGKGVVTIARELNEAGVPTLSGSGTWYSGVVLRLLKSLGVPTRERPGAAKADPKPARRRQATPDPKAKGNTTTKRRGTKKAATA